jgi:peptidoglycan/LPS O-acetylase OafA/YrhL
MPHESVTTTIRRTDASPKAFRHLPVLDGVRALAILLVIGQHMAQKTVVAGYVGVDVFFVLSGFLITTLLVRERTGTGAIGIRAFYTRRALRLLPALFAAIVLGLLLAVTFATPGIRESTLKGLPWVVFYSSDFAEASHRNLGLFNHTWSLAIEEQFYLLWPLLLLLICRARRRLEIAAVGLAMLAVADMLWSAYLASTAGHDRAYASLDGHAMGLLGGAALALMWHGATEWHLTPAARRLLQAAAAASVLGILLASVLFRTVGTTVLAMSLSTVLTVILISTLLGVADGPVHYLFSSRPAIWIGKRSYGLYLYNFMLFYTFETLRPRDKTVDIVCLIATFAIAALSYKYLEQPFLRRKARYSVVPAS